MAARAAIGGLLLAAVAAIYATGLSRAPIYLMHDEVNYALQAHAIAESGRDTNGRFMPVYFSEPGFEAGRDPISIYAMAAALLVLPLSEGAVRLPVALMGVLNVLLMWALARRLFSSERLGALAALLLALTPSHFINARLALAIVFPLPFLMLWLICTERFATRPSRGAAVGAGLALGLGVYSYLAALVMMPAYLALSLAAVWREWRRPPARLLVLSFLAGLLPLLAWHWFHPDRLEGLMAAYRPLGEASAESAPGALEILRGRLNIAWSFFSPDLWFIGGSGKMTNSTRMAGLFPLAFVVLLPVGGYAMWRGRVGKLGPVILAGCAIAPLATVVSGQLEVYRILFILPFGVLVASAGAAALLRAEGLRRWVGIGLVVSVGIQFAGVYLDYVGPYRERSADWFGGNMRGAVLSAITHKEMAGGVVWLSARTPIERYWRFYAIATGHPDWETSPSYYDPATMTAASITGPAILICDVGEAPCQSIGNSGSWNEVERIVEPNGRESFTVFVRGDQ